MRGVEGRSWINEVDHVVADTTALLGRGLVGGDVQTLVHLPRIGDDYLTTQLQRQVEGQPGLADAGWTDDDRDGSQ